MVTVYQYLIFLGKVRKMIISYEVSHCAVHCLFNTFLIYLKKKVL
jgi:hypothetical protein